MSINLLKKLNGNRTGLLRRCLENLDGPPRIAWYPSSGEDYRDLLYLSSRYTGRFPTVIPAPAAPNFFIHTNYFLQLEPTFLKSRIVYRDAKTRISILDAEELETLNLTLDDQVVDFPLPNEFTNRVYFLHVEITSSALGRWHAPLIYIFAENASFYKDVTNERSPQFSHIVHVRYGGSGGGGGKSSGVWIKNVLKRAGCEVHITDNQYFIGHGDQRIFTKYPDLQVPDAYAVKPIRKIPSVKWSCNGDVVWELII